jgi:hypothetical protein
MFFHFDHSTLPELNRSEGISENSFAMMVEAPWRMNENY